MAIWQARTKINLVPYQLTPEQEEPETDDVRTFDMVLHNQFRPRSCIGASMQYQTGRAAPDYGLLSQDSNALQGTRFAVCEGSPRRLLVPSPLPHPTLWKCNLLKGVKQDRGRSPLLALDEAGLSKPAGRTVPGDGCKRPNQTVISGQQNAREAAKIEAGASCPRWRASAPLERHVSCELAHVLTHVPLAPRGSTWGEGKASPWDPGSHGGRETAIPPWVRQLYQLRVSSPGRHGFQVLQCTSKYQVFCSIPETKGGFVWSGFFFPLERQQRTEK